MREAREEECECVCVCVWEREREGRRRTGQRVNALTRMVGGGLGKPGQYSQYSTRSCY
jgi:hypothetical protein